MQATTIVTPATQATGLGRWARTLAASERPVTMPSFADRCWRKISMSVLSETTHSRS